MRCMTSIFGSPETLVATPRLTGLETHPHDDGAVVLRQELTSDGKKYVRHAWSVLPDERGERRAGGPGVDDGGAVAVRRLTHGDHGVAEIRPAAGGSLYFTSDRPADDEDEKRTRLWLLPPHGEARVVVDRCGGVGNLKLGGERLFFVGGTLPSALGAEDETAEHERLHTLREDSGASAILYETAPTRHWDHDLGPEEPALWWLDDAPLRAGDDAAPTAHRIPVPRGVLADYFPAPDGSFVLLATKTWIAGNWERAELWRVPAEGGAGEPLLLREASETEWWQAGPVSPDGTRAVLLREKLWTATANLEMSLWVYDFATGQASEVLPTQEHWGEDPQWLDDETLVCSADHHGRGVVLRISCPRDGEVRVTTAAGGHGQDWTYSNVCVAGEQLWALRSRIDRPSELVRWPAPNATAPNGAPDAAADGAAEPVKVAGLVPDATPEGRLEEVTARGEDGAEIRGWLALPDDAAPGPLPLLVFVHGGPWNSNNAWSWRWNPWPFVERSYAVLLPDPAISTGYGQAMIDRGQQELGGAPFTDVMALVEATTGRADIDPDRQALLGGSYGGYMANWVAGHTGDRFRCIVTHASLWDLGTMGTTTDNTEWQEATERGHAAEYSPHRFVGEIRVPMLVIHGDKDYRVPVSQGLQLWSDLQRKTDVAGHRFLYYPDEGHWILKPANARTWYETVLAFVDEHVRGEEWARPELLG